MEGIAQAESLAEKIPSINIIKYQSDVVLDDRLVFVYLSYSIRPPLERRVSATSA